MKICVTEFLDNKLAAWNSDNVTQICKQGNRNTKDRTQMPTSEAELQSWCTEMILMQNITVQKAYWML